MLIVKRKPGEVIYIGTDIKITYNGLYRGRAKICIEAPDSVKVVWPRATNKNLERKL